MRGYGAFGGHEVGLLYQLTNCSRKGQLTSDAMVLDGSFLPSSFQLIFLTCAVLWQGEAPEVDSEGLCQEPRPPLSLGSFGPQVPSPGLFLLNGGPVLGPCFGVLI